MKNKKFYYCIYTCMIIVGILLVTVGVIITLNSKNLLGLNGLLYGVGSALLGLGIGYLFIFKYTPKKRLKQITIEKNDERNVVIKNKSLALAGRISNSLVCVLLAVDLLLNQVSFITWSLLCINLTYTIAYIFFYYKFQHKF